MNKYNAFYHQSTILSPIRLTELAREVELRIEEGEVCSEEQTDVKTGVIPGRFSLTTPVLPDYCVHIPCPQGDGAVQSAISGHPSYALVLHG